MKENIVRCAWLNEDPLYVKYHDVEWGKPEYNSVNLFEMICLEGQQAGLSWITVLKKRENYRNVFFKFNAQKISELKDNDIQNLVKNSGIIRHKGKINAIINNAKCYLNMEKNNEDFSTFVWSFVNNKPIVNKWSCVEEIPSKTDLSIELSKALQIRGFMYIGPTICYAFMQACGLVNDHVIDCICYNKYT